MRPHLAAMPTSQCWLRELEVCPYMYETEVNQKLESGDEIPLGIVLELSKQDSQLLGRTVLPWSEHCTECVWPACYSTCDLYSPREDGKCRRFVDGMVRVDTPTAFNSYLLKIRFKRWGKLWTPGNIHLYSAEKAQKLERRDYLIGTSLVQIPLPSPLKSKVASKRYNFKKRMTNWARRNDEMPTCFLVECYNPESQTVPLSLTMRAADAEKKISFQRLIELTPGFHRVRIPIAEIGSVLDLRSPFSIDLIPNIDALETTLYFGLMEFIREAAQPVAEVKTDKAKMVKCVVWDLDNTLWNGILVEDGAQKLKLKDGIADVIRALDERGILLSIASKNNLEEALQALKQFHLDKYFLCPQISWQPKSESILTIARQLNIGVDTLLFVDDAAFELEEVRRACPEVRTLDASLYRTLPDMKELRVPVTDESRSRRSMYQLEGERKAIADRFGNDYMAFLKDCQIELSVGPLAEENLTRVHELTQRTNQMNFSGNRYDRSVLETIRQSSHLDTYVLSCRDRFGSYGVIGFSIVDRGEPRMIDLMFSCRVQSKRVEHAFVAFILEKYIGESRKDFYANYRETPRNAFSGRVFRDVGMEAISVNDGVTDLIFRKEKTVPNDRVIEVIVNQDALSAS
jgi:FkbH-like protein